MEYQSNLNSSLLNTPPIKIKSLEKITQLAADPVDRGPTQGLTNGASQKSNIGDKFPICIIDLL